MAAKKKTTKKKTATRKTSKRKTTKRAPARKKTAKRKTTKRAPAKKKNTKRKTTKRAPTKKKAAKKKATKRKTTKKKAAKRKTTKRAPTKKKVAKKKAAKRRTTKRAPARKKTAKRRTTKRAPAKRRTTKKKVTPLRGVSRLRTYLRQLDQAISHADNWIAAVERESNEIEADFTARLAQLAQLDEALNKDEEIIELIRRELLKVSDVTPALQDVRTRLTSAVSTVAGMRDDLRAIAKSRGVESLFDWARGAGADLLAKATCVTVADRFGTSTRTCGTSMRPDSATKILDAARRRDFPALAEWVVRTRTPIVSGGSVPPTEEDFEQARVRIDRTLGPPPTPIGGASAVKRAPRSQPPKPAPESTQGTGESSEPTEQAKAVEEQMRLATGL